MAEREEERKKERINNNEAALLYMLSIIHTMAFSCINRAAGASIHHQLGTLHLTSINPEVVRVCTTSSLSLKAYTAESEFYI